jgi:predicted acyl esterase
MAMRYAAGEELYLTISPLHPSSTDFDMGFGAALIEVPDNAVTYLPGEVGPMKTLGGTAATSPSFARELTVPTPVSRNRGTHIIHVGGKYDSHLLIPVVSA